MQGKKEPDQKLFYTVTLDSLVPQDHSVRQMAKVLDLSFLYEATRPYYSHEGKPSVDPVVLFKLYILGYFFGIDSERQLLREVQVNLAYRWYLGYDLDEQLPDHSILTKSRYRFPESVFAMLFARIVALCKEAGLISGTYQFMDSTLVKADASKNSFGHKLKTEQEYLADLQRKEEKQYHGTAFDGSVDPEKMGKRRERNRKNDDYVSRTDADARMIHRPSKGTFSAYKAHFCVDRRDRVIVAVDASVATDDDMTKIDELFTGATLAVGRNPRTVVADSHYGGIEPYKYFQDRGVETCMPLRKAGNRAGIYTNVDFELSDDRMQCTCPQGHKSYQRTVNKKRYRYIYRFKADTCNGCVDKDKCTRTDKGRIVTYFQGDYVERAEALVNSERGKKLMRARQIIVEGVIGEMKDHHLLRRCRQRGLINLKRQLHITAAVVNLKRLVKQQRQYGSPGMATALKAAVKSLQLKIYGQVSLN